MRKPKTDAELTRDLLKTLMKRADELRAGQMQIMTRLNAIEIGIANEAFLAEERTVTVTVNR